DEPTAVPGPVAGRRPGEPRRRHRHGGAPAARRRAGNVPLRDALRRGRQAGDGWRPDRAVPRRRSRAGLLMDVPTILGTSALRLPGKTAVVHGSRSLTFAGILDRGRRFATYLAESGISPGDRVALLCTNTVELFELQLGCQLADVVLTPLNF